MRSESITLAQERKRVASKIATFSRNQRALLQSADSHAATHSGGIRGQTNDVFASRVLRNRPRHDVKTTNTEVFGPSEMERVLKPRRFVERLSSLQACPQCWSHRTRRLGPADFVYYRCEACEYVFHPRDEGTEQSPRVSLETPNVCPKCGDNRTRIVGQSGAPALVHRSCQVCGHVWSRGLNAREAPR
jgi:hypothetical protein